MNLRSSRLITGTAAVCLVFGFGTGVWTGILLKKDQSRSGAGANSSDGFKESGSGSSSRDFRAAAAAAEGSLGAGEDSIPALEGLPLREVWKKLMGLKDSSQRREAALRLLKGMPPKERLPWIEKMGEEMEKISGESGLAQVALTFGTMDDLMHASVTAGPEETLNATGIDHALVPEIAARWAERDPAAAKAWFTKALATSGSTAGSGDQIAESMAVALARGSGREALNWAAGLPEELKAKANQGAVRELSRTNPKEAARMLSLHAGSVDDPEALAARVAAALAEEDPEAALEWAAAADEGLRGAALIGALQSRAQRDFPSALAAVKALEGEAASLGLTAVLKEAPPERLPEVAALLEAQPEGEARAAASGDLMRAWTGKSPEEASAWMKRQPPGPVRDEAISAFVGWAGTNDPQAALLWAGAVSDPGKRTGAIDQIIGQLGAKAPEAVEAWLAANPALPEEEKERIRNNIRSAGSESR